MSSSTATAPATRPAGERVARVILLVVAVFLVVAAAFALVIATTLLVPGTVLDGVWAMKPSSRIGFVAIGGWGILLMVLLAAVLLVAAIGVFRRRPWARWVAFALLAVNVIPDAVQSLAQPVILIPIAVVAAVAVYLALPVTGRACRRGSVHDAQSAPE